VSKNNRDWPWLLEEIRQRPSLWIGAKSPICLCVFIDGIKYAEHIHNIVPGKCLAGFHFQEFEEWVESQFNPTRLTYSSFYLALHLNDSEEKAFDTWFDWYREFARMQDRS
jgi:hypothetical protein